MRPYRHEDAEKILDRVAFIGRYGVNGGSIPGRPLWKKERGPSGPLLGSISRPGPTSSRPSHRWWTASCAPDGGGWRERRARPRRTCVCGSRVCSRACACWAGRCVSSPWVYFKRVANVALCSDRTSPFRRGLTAARNAAGHTPRPALSRLHPPRASGRPRQRPWAWR